MMSDVLLGCDIMPAGVHITASMLSGAHPAITYSNSSILLMPYSKQADNTISLGSIDLLQKQGTFPILTTRAIAVGATGAKAQDAWHTIPDQSFHFVVMNPPFVRPTNHEGDRRDVPNPMFAAFSSSEEEQEAMSGQMKKVAGHTVYHGNAGEASAFLALAERKLAPNGQLALVMPLSLQMGQGWKDCRELIQQKYQNLCVVNIAAAKDAEASFSAATKMGECLIVGQRTAKPSMRALFVILAASPNTPLSGATIARHVREQWRSPTLRKLEDGPLGGTEIRVGDDLIVTMIEGPLPGGGSAWPISRVGDVSVAQAAHQLVERKKIWLPGMPQANSIDIPMCGLPKLASIGPLDRDINGTEYSNNFIRGPFQIVVVTPGGVPTYPVLWNHDADRERQLIVGPDSEGLIRKGKDDDEDKSIRERANKVWGTASHVHFNRDFRFNSQSTAACYTIDRSIGGRAWPSISFKNLTHEKPYVLWANCTLGLLCYWWRSNKAQTGRGSITITALPNLMIFDFSTLTDKQVETANKAFDDFKARDLRPFHEIDIDVVRHELDRVFFVDVLGLNPNLLSQDGAIVLLRRKLAHEPSIHGGKRKALEIKLPPKPKAAKPKKTTKVTSSAGASV
jgi:hypothetical protein